MSGQRMITWEQLQDIHEHVNSDEGLQKAFDKLPSAPSVECPKVEWKGRDAMMVGHEIGDITHSSFNENWSGWLFGANNGEVFRTESEAREFVESAWKEFWAKIHGGVA